MASKTEKVLTVGGVISFFVVAVKVGESEKIKFPIPTETPEKPTAVVSPTLRAQEMAARVGNDPKLQETLQVMQAIDASITNLLPTPEPTMTLEERQLTMNIEAWVKDQYARNNLPLSSVTVRINNEGTTYRSKSDYADHNERAFPSTSAPVTGSFPRLNGNRPNLASFRYIVDYSYGDSDGIHKETWGTTDIYSPWLCIKDELIDNFKYIKIREVAHFDEVRQ